MFRVRSLLPVVSCLILLSPALSAEERGGLKEDAVPAAMKKASDFMMETVSNRGGFVSLYTEDLSERWGEVPARDSMIWVQDPGTVGVGRTLLEAYRTTGDARISPIFRANRECPRLGPTPLRRLALLHRLRPVRNREMVHGSRIDGVGLGRVLPL